MVKGRKGDRRNISLTNKLVENSISTFPRLLVISEATFSDEATGINRTLVNLFKDYPADRLLIVTPEENLRKSPPGKRLENRVLGVSYKKLPFSSQITSLPGRIQTWIERRNFAYLAHQGIREFKHILSYNPQRILLCTNSMECFLIGASLQKHLDVPFFTYAMDDWRDHETVAWNGSNGRTLIQEILSKSSGWIMISEALEHSYRDRFRLAPGKVLIVHNPIEASAPIKSALEDLHKEVFEIAYAGSVWPMHLDALLSCAQAVNELRERGLPIRLTLYTSENFWSIYRKEWEKYSVNYGGFIPYESLKETLSQADLLLSSSSFEEKSLHLSYSSVQTKLTDYMSAARPILSIGPEGCACNEFVRKWSCGLVYESNAVGGLKELLIWTMKNRVEIKRLGQQGFDAAQNYFTTDVVNQKLYSFLSDEKGIVPSATGKLTLSWQAVCFSLAKDKDWQKAISYLTPEEIKSGLTLNRLWKIMDTAWDELKNEHPKSSLPEFLGLYYRHPIWLLMGAFSESDADTVEDRLAAIRLISSVAPSRILDFGGGIGTACRLAALELPQAKVIDLVDIGPFAATVRSHLAAYQAVRVIEKPEPPYDAIICTEVLEHLIDPVQALVQMNGLLRIGGAIALSYSFAPGIKCHLPQNFHLKNSMLWIIRALGFGFYGFERRGSTVYGFIKHADVTDTMLYRARFLAKMSRLRIPYHRLLLALRGL